LEFRYPERRERSAAGESDDLGHAAL
jgi:hypothetical protein